MFVKINWLFLQVVHLTHYDHRLKQFCSQRLKYIKKITVCGKLVFTQNQVYNFHYHEFDFKSIK